MTNTFHNDVWAMETMGNEGEYKAINYERVGKALERLSFEIGELESERDNEILYGQSFKMDYSNESLTFEERMLAYRSYERSEAIVSKLERKIFEAKKQMKTLGECVKVIRQGISKVDDDGFGIQWWLVESSMSDETIRIYLDAKYHYSGPGQSFQREGIVRRQGDRILVTQSFGRDI